MSVALLFPLGLIALAGLIVPLLIHLIRRPEQHITDFAALRWLRESVRPRRRLQFDDLGLLLTRLALIAMVALLIALPMLKGDWREARHVVAVDTGVDLVAARKQVDDARAEWLWLTPGFPAIGETITETDQPLSSLLRELDASLPAKDSLSVLVPAEIGGLDAQRIVLTRAIDWQEVAGKSDATTPAQQAGKQTIAIRYGADDSTGLRYLRAAVGVWNAIGSRQWQVDDQPLATPLPDKTDALIWLDAPLPDSIKPWIRHGGRVLLVDGEVGQGQPVWRSDQADVVASEERLGRGAVIHLQATLTPESLPGLLDADFPQRLQALFLPVPRPPERAFAREVEPLVVNRAVAKSQTSLIALIGLLAALLFLLERVLATRRQIA
ncbi:MAG TPA: BatA domain-containing protein [Dokdonella sp.]|uniref:BatA domain-containing protein n=1 Tax=Dokdonella sp. TaxID=2291710 RepID=UPI002D8064FA|nr:BatA domain-containing protein [Dokdonella sp.]HET9033827.1 BatA domain-containing protein [Dokdonella sp.]